MTESKKLCAGLYKVSLGQWTVTLTHFSPKEDGAAFTGWIASADWDNYLFSDPLATKAKAMEVAKEMLRQAKETRL